MSRNDEWRIRIRDKTQLCWSVRIERIANLILIVWARAAKALIMPDLRMSGAHSLLGRGGIRTHGNSRHIGFQNQHHRPLGHPSKRLNQVANRVNLDSSDLNLLPRTRIELVTRGFSILCSTDWAISAWRKFFIYEIFCFLFYEEAKGLVKLFLFYGRLTCQRAKPQLPSGVIVRNIERESGRNGIRTHGSKSSAELAIRFFRPLRHPSKAWASFAGSYRCYRSERPQCGRWLLSSFDLSSTRLTTVNAIDQKLTHDFEELVSNFEGYIQ